MSTYDDIVETAKDAMRARGLGDDAHPSYMVGWLASTIEAIAKASDAGQVHEVKKLINAARGGGKR